jgi:hypothetical protein
MGYLEFLANKIADAEAREEAGYPDPEYHGLQVSFQSEINALLPDPEPDFPPA